MSSQTINLSHLDAVAREHSCQVEQKGDKRIYTSRTLTGCSEIYRAITNRAESEAIEIRQGVGNHYEVRHPLPLTVWR